MIDMKMMAKGLMDMKRPKKSDKEIKAGRDAMPTQDPYPYGLRITLDKDGLTKLGIKTAGRTVGEKVTVLAEGTIEEISQRQASGGMDDSRMEIQIKKLKII